MAEPNALRILVVNGKGGCGKTTIATNLAAAYARLGYCVALTDHDLKHRAHSGSNNAPHRCRASIWLQRINARRCIRRARFNNVLPNEVERIIVDTPSAVNDRELDTLLRGIDVILVPLLPSSIDIRAGARFITQLLAHRSYRLRPVPVGVIANRVRQNTTTHAKLMQFLECLDVPTVATFRDSALYTRLAEEGTGIFDDVADSSAEREALEWSKLMHWIDEVTSQNGVAN